MVEELKDYSLPQEPANHLGKTLQVGSTKMVRCCHVLEKSLSPTIVCKEKKAYGVFTPFDRKKDQYRIA